MKGLQVFRNTFKTIQTFYRFSAEATAAPTTAKEKTVATKDETPVHLKPYNRSKYEVPSDKIKVIFF
jgi:hypothetical protein